jgi:hypothetical protein
MSISINGTIPTLSDDKTGISYFACTCADQDQEFWNTQRELYLAENETDPTCFATSMLYELYNLETVVEGVGVDMWMGIYLKCYKSETQTIELTVQCDEFEIGLLAAFEIVKNIDSIIGGSDDN